MSGADMSSILIKNVRIVDAEQDRPASVLVQDGIIARVAPFAETAVADAPSGTEVFDGGGLCLQPAFIDMHAHFRYPGQEQKEDLDSGISAAVAGGFCAVVTMPNTSPVVSSRGMAERIEAEAAVRKKLDVFQAVSLTRDFDGADTSHLADLDKNTTPVISEDGNDVQSAAVMLSAMRIAGQKGIIVSCHSEDIPLRDEAKPWRQKALSLMRQHGIPAWGESANSSVAPEVDAEIDFCLGKANGLLALAEDIATERNLRIAEEARCHVHIAHCSTARSIDAVRRAKALQSGSFRVSAEVTPHHISLAGDSAPFIRALVNPPLRPQSDVDALIAAVKDGTADVISTDHAPHTFSDKAAGSPGFTGLETAFAVCNTVLVKGGHISAQKLSALMSRNPAGLLGLQNRGLIKEGFAADLVLLDTEKEFTVDTRTFFSKGKASPQNGRRLCGTVERVWYRGVCVLKK